MKAFSGDVWATCGSMQVHITLNPTPDMAVHHRVLVQRRFNIANGTVVIAKKVDGQIHGAFGHGGKASRKGTSPGGRRRWRRVRAARAAAK